MTEYYETPSYYNRNHNNHDLWEYCEMQLQERLKTRKQIYTILSEAENSKIHEFMMNLYRKKNHD